MNVSAVGSITKKAVLHPVKTAKVASKKVANTVRQSVFEPSKAFLAQKKPTEYGVGDSARTAFTTLPKFRYITNRADSNVLEMEMDVSKLDFAKFLPNKDIMPSDSVHPHGGDIICIHPRNDPHDMDRVEKALKSDHEKMYYLEGKSEIQDSGQDLSRHEALQHLSLNPVKPELLQLIKKKIDENPLHAYLQTGESYKKLDDILKMPMKDPDDRGNLLLKHTHLADVLEAFPHVLRLQEVCDTQKGMIRRAFSIADIDHQTNGKMDKATLWISTGVNYTVPKGSFGEGKTYDGATVGFLERLAKQQESGKLTEDPRVQMYFYPYDTFGLPEKQAFEPHQEKRQFHPMSIGENVETTAPSFKQLMNRPVLMLTAGSGAAASNFAGHVRRSAKEKGFDVGKVITVIGVRDAQQDKGLIDQALKNSDEVYIAASRQKGTPKTYIQHVLAGKTPFGKDDKAYTKELETTAEYLKSMKDLYVLICGDQKLGEAIQPILEKEYKLDPSRISQSTSTTRSHKIFS